MIANDNDVYVLEVNTIPGFTETSLVPDAAKAENISFEDLVDFIVQEKIQNRQKTGLEAEILKISALVLKSPNSKKAQGHLQNWGVKIFDDFWMNYMTVEMARSAN